MVWRDVLPNLAAQVGAATALAIGIAWWGRKAVVAVRKMRVWHNAVEDERFAERFSQHVQAALEPQFAALDRRLDSLEGRFDTFEVDTKALHDDLRLHMSTEDNQ